MELTPVERTILVHLLLEGDDVAANIGDTEDDDKPHPQSVTRSFRCLSDRGLVENKGAGVYRLTNQGLTAARIVLNSTDRGSENTV